MSQAFKYGAAEQTTQVQVSANNKALFLQVYHSMMQAARGVVQQHGPRGLYRGLNITLLEIIPYAALQFGLYDTFTAAWSKAHRRRLAAKVTTYVLEAEDVHAANTVSEPLVSG